MSITESIVDDATLMWFGELGCNLSKRSTMTIL